MFFFNTIAKLRRLGELTLGLAILVLAMTGSEAVAQDSAGRKHPAKTDQAEAKRLAREALAKHTVTVTRSKDGTPQKAVFYVPEGAAAGRPGEPVPLLVALHTWSGGYEQGLGYVPFAKERQWVMVAPDFRGVNKRPEACASDLAVQDVLDAVQYAQQHARVDAARIYLTGNSGGGHMSLVMAARAPQLWAGVSAWVPISDLAAWHAECTAAKRHYAQMLEQVCGGAPGSPQTDAQYRSRSSLFILAAAKGLPLDINAGIHDGHTGSVPISQSLRAFNVVAEANGFKDRQIAETDIASMTREQKVPATLAAGPEKDPERKMAVLLRRVAGPARITIFEGGHDAEISAALDWLARQRKGAPVNHQAPAGGAAPGSSQGGSQTVSP
jgi:pimeloyl-ACP methyl ester carboxylesterase